MISSAHAAHPAQLSGIALIESAAKATRQPDPGPGASNRKGLAAWTMMWAIGFAALGLFAGTARKLAARAAAGFSAWSQRAARARADAHFLETARHDPRIMAELQAAITGRREDEPDGATAESAMAATAPQAAAARQERPVMVALALPIIITIVNTVNN